MFVGVGVGSTKRHRHVSYAFTTAFLCFKPLPQGQRWLRPTALVSLRASCASQRMIGCHRIKPLCASSSRQTFIWRNVLEKCLCSRTQVIMRRRPDGETAKMFSDKAAMDMKSGSHSDDNRRSGFPLGFAKRTARSLLFAASMLCWWILPSRCPVDKVVAVL